MIKYDSIILQSTTKGFAVLAIVGVVLMVLSGIGACVVVNRLPNESDTLKAILNSETPVENQMREDIAKRKKLRDNLLIAAMLLFTAGAVMMALDVRH